MKRAAMKGSLSVWHEVLCVLIQRGGHGGNRGRGHREAKRHMRSTGLRGVDRSVIRRQEDRSEGSDSARVEKPAAATGECAVGAAAVATACGKELGTIGQ